MILRSNLVELYDFTLNFCRNVECRVVDYIKKRVGFSGTSFLLSQVGETLN